MADNWKKVKVSLRNSETEAYIEVPILTEKGAQETPLTIADAHTALTNAGVTEGIKEEVLKSIFNDSLFAQEVLVAESIPPKNGADGRIEFFFRHKQVFEPREDSDGRIDFKDISFLNSVSKDDQLCRRHPPTPGEPGFTVTGKPIQQNAGKDRELPVGKNTRESGDDPNLLIAETGGSVTLNKRTRKVEVQQNLEIKGDVDYSTGNIDFNGSLLVKGDIKAGFEVKVTGDLEIGGCVEDAEVEAEGSIMVKKGFLGRGKGIIRGGSDVTVKYIQGQEVICEGDLNIGGELMNGKVRVGGNVNVTSRKGAIIGGVIMAQCSVETTQVGNENYTHTEIFVGSEFKLTDRLKQVAKELEQIAENQDKLKKGVYTLSRKKIVLTAKRPPDK